MAVVVDNIQDLLNEPVNLVVPDKIPVYTDKDGRKYTIKIYAHTQTAKLRDGTVKEYPVTCKYKKYLDKNKPGPRVKYNIADHPEIADKIKKMHADGISVRQIASELDLYYFYVYHFVKKL